MFHCSAANFAVKKRLFEREKPHSSLASSTHAAPLSCAPARSSRIKKASLGALSSMRGRIRIGPWGARGARGRSRLGPAASASPRITAVPYDPFAASWFTLGAAPAASAGTARGHCARGNPPLTQWGRLGIIKYCPTSASRESRRLPPPCLPSSRAASFKPSSS
jgi:hypothetical protein